MASSMNVPLVYILNNKSCFHPSLKNHRKLNLDFQIEAVIITNLRSMLITNSAGILLKNSAGIIFEDMVALYFRADMTSWGKLR